MFGTSAPAPPAFVGPHPAAALGPFQPHWRRILHLTYAACDPHKACPSSPFVDQESAESALGVQCVRAGTHFPVSSVICLGHSLTSGAELSFFEYDRKDVTGFCYCLYD